MKTKKLIITRLHCNQTEDYTGGDECRLRVYINGCKVSDTSKDLNDGDNWYMYLPFEIDEHDAVKVTLYDKDGDHWYDRDDDLGTVKVNKNAGMHKGTFNKDGANYKLHYYVEETFIGERYLSITTLLCRKTEDITGGDECLLKVYIDDNEKAVLEKDLNDTGEGDLWDLYINNIKLNSDSKVELKLWDKDSPDSDDYLGSVILYNGIGEHKGYFTNDDANYVLSYNIENENRHKFRDKLYVKHLPVDIPVVDWFAEHTYLVAEKKDGQRQVKWKAFGGDSGGSVLDDTTFEHVNGVDINTLNYVMEEYPKGILWPKNPFYATVGVCWNACNRGLYFVHKTVHKIKFYIVIETYFGTYGLDDDSTCFTDLCKEGRRLYSWTKTRREVARNHPWQGFSFNDFSMAKSENYRIKVYHEFFGDSAKKEYKILEPEDRWFNYLQRLLKLHLRIMIPEINETRINLLLNIHSESLGGLYSIDRKANADNMISHIEEQGNNMLERFKKELTDEEYKKVFNADKSEKFSIPR